MTHQVTMKESLTSIIQFGEASTEVAISDPAARQLAGELAQLQQNPTETTQAELYASMKAGTARFMGRLIVVAEK